jgi:uncharacterized linocin/CFP29 family protein
LCGACPNRESQRHPQLVRSIRSARYHSLAFRSIRRISNSKITNQKENMPDLETTTPTESPVAHLADPHSEAPPEEADESLHHKENKKVPWSEDVWKAIHKTVHEETLRVRIGAQFLPHRRVHPKTMSVPPDTITNLPIPGELTNTLTVDEGQSIRINEIWSEFALTTQQVHDTAEAKNPLHTTAVTLARRAAMYLALGQDTVIFQGYNAYSTPLFSSNVNYRQNQLPADGGLLSLNGGLFASPNPIIQVQPLPQSPPGVTWGENTLSAVTAGYAALVTVGEPGPFALVLSTPVFADLFAAVGIGSLVITADRVQPLVKAGLFGTDTINPAAGSPPSSPPGGSYYGVLASLGGDTMDLVVGLHATTVFMQQDLNQLWRFRVTERFALRVLDPFAIQVFEFLPA